MKEDLKKVLRQTTITMTISICALVMGVILIFVSWQQEKKISIVGIIIVIAMVINIIPAVKRRRERSRRKLPGIQGYSTKWIDGIWIAP